MRRQAVLGDIGRDVGGAPARQWIDLHMLAVGLEHRQVKPRGGLEALAAADPGVEAGERALQRRDLAEGAAAVGIPACSAEIGVEASDFLGAGADAADAAEPEMG